MIIFIGNFYFSIGYSKDKRSLRDHLLKVQRPTPPEIGKAIDKHFWEF